MAEPESDENNRLLERCTHDLDYAASATSSRNDFTESKSHQRDRSSAREHHPGRHLDRISRHLPFVKWVPEYRSEWFPGDFMGALTVASLYVPLSVSFSILAHAHPVSGLYSFVISPLLYALLGTCPLMVVGPEASGSLLVGTFITLSNPGTEGDDSDLVNAQMAGTVTALTGMILFVAGLSRLGYVDAVLSRPFMRGFIGAVGLNVVIEQTVTGLGLGTLIRQDPVVAGGSPASRLLFVVTHLTETHLLSAVVFLASFVVIMTIRHFRNSLELHYRAIAYVPDRFVVVAFSAVLTWLLGWHEQGLQVLGHIRTPDTLSMPFRWPFTLQHINNVPSLISTACLIALLGLFESSLTSKSLRKANGAPKATNLPLNADQELAALGVANMVGGCFFALPSFGGYGRSKLNFSTGGRTQMSNVLLSGITLCCIFFVLPAFYYVPRGVLAAMIAVVGVSMIEECPHEIFFFTKVGAWPELLLMTLVFGATVFHSISLGMALGLAWSIAALVVYRAWRAKVQVYDSLIEDPHDGELAQIPTLSSVRMMLVGVYGALTFANTGDLKDRVDVLEYQAMPRHPISQPSVTHSSPNTEQVIIFDMRHCTIVDGCAVQVLAEIAEHHGPKSTKVLVWKPLQLSGTGNILYKLSLSGAVSSCGNNLTFVTSVEEIMAELGPAGEGRLESVFESPDV